MGNKPHKPWKKQNPSQSVQYVRKTPGHIQEDRSDSSEDDYVYTLSEDKSKQPQTSITVKVLGKFKASAKSSQGEIDTEFYVTKGNNGCLLGYQSAAGIS